MIHIEINPNKGKLSGDLKILNKLFNEFKIKHPRSFHIRVKGKGNWDGNIKYISEYGNFKVGLLPLIVKRIEELGHKYKIHDERPQVKIQPKIPNYIGENKLRPYQKDILKALLFNKVGDIDFRMGVANAATNAGKALSNDSLVLTASGWVKISKLKVGDLVMNPVDGLPVRAIGVYPQGIRDTMKISFKDGSHTICDESHIWSVCSRGRKGKPLINLTAIEMYNNGVYEERFINRKRGKPGVSKVYKYYTPLTKPLDFDEKSLPINPYILGFILGDGCISGKRKTVRVSTNIVDCEEVHNRLIGFGAELRLRHNYPNKGVNHFNIIGIYDGLLELGLVGKKSESKYIPDIYLYSSIDQRKMLLAGLLDTDGTKLNTDRKERGVRFSSKSKELSLGVLNLVRSLGGWGTIKEKDRTKEGKSKSYVVNFIINFNPFLREYKSNSWVLVNNKPNRKYHYYNTIIGIEKYKKEKCTCIKVDSKEGLFITNDFVVTHNTTIMVGVHKAFKSKLNTLILTQDADWFNQAKVELPLLTDGEKIGFIRGTSTKQEWHKINVAMVQTLSRNVLYFEKELSNIDILLIDECDLSNNNMYKKVIERLFNASIRLGFSGTIFMSNLKKDAIKNMDIRTTLGDQLAYVSKKWMMDKGYSTKVTVRIVEGNTDKPKERRDSKGRKIRLSYKEIYDELITDNRNRHRKSYKRTMHNINRGRLPCLIVCHYIPHVENLYNYFKNKLDRKKVRYTIAHCHNETKNRAKIISDFREGKIDILIASFIIRRGKNFPLLRYLQNASATDSKESVSQLMGRLERTHESKNRAYMDDLYDTGDKYLLRHSNHRIKLYKQEGVRLIRRIKKKVTL